jgi:sec-independent protein translocase protein TatA
MTLSILLGILGGQEVLIIAILVLLLFGGKKIPELMRGLGKGIKEFKDAKDGTEEHKDEEKK